MSVTQVGMFDPDEIEVSDSDSWCTPAWICQLVYRYFDDIPDLDSCTNRHAIMGARVKWTIADDCLNQPTWLVGSQPKGDGTKIWVQPPYSNPGPFLARMGEECHKGGHALALVKHDHSTRWWEAAARDAIAYALLKDRVKHLLAGVEGDACSFPSTVILPYSEHADRDRFRQVFGEVAQIVEVA